MEKRDDRNVAPGAGQRGKRKYEPPEILSQEVFETTALACMKVVGGACGASPKS
jgi:hypothetical protein